MSSRPLRSKSRPKQQAQGQHQARFHTNLASSIMPTIESTGTIPGISLRTQNSSSYSHYPLPEEPSGLYDTLITDSDMALTKKKFLKVSSVGEVEVQPDRIEFCIQISSSKLDIAQSKESIKKREDYILSTLKKLKVQDDEIVLSTIVKKYTPTFEDQDVEMDVDEMEAKIIKRLKQTNAGGKGKEGEGNELEETNENNKVPTQTGEQLKLLREICVGCDSLMKYTQVYSICNEKLDRHVVVSPPVVRFTPEYIQLNTQKVLKLTMDNGIKKANELISSMKHRVKLGRLYYSVEDSLTMSNVEDYDIGVPAKFETFSWRRMNKVIRCSLTSVFELEHPKIRKMI